MAQIAGLMDFRKQGAPADIGTFLQPATAIVFQFTFSGTTTIVSMAVGVSGWVLIDQGAVVATVINAALTAVGGAVDGEVVVLEGAYTVLATLNVPESVLFRGVGWATIFNYDAGGNCITITGDNAKVRDLKVVIAVGAGGAGTRPNCIYAGSVDRVEIIGCWVIGDETVDDDGTSLRQTGIVFNVVTESKIANCTSEDNDRQGIYIYESPRNTIIGNICRSNSANGIYLYTNSIQNTIVGNNCPDNGGNGISNMISETVITGNSCTGSGSHGIYLAFEAHENTISGNICSGNGTYGIELADPSNYNTITGNTCQGNTRGIDIFSHDNTITGNTCQGNTNGIEIGAAGDDCTITGNTCLGNNRGIYVRGSGCTVVGNNCQGNTSDGLQTVSGADNYTMTGNMFNGNGGHGMRLQDADYGVVTGNTCQGNTEHGIYMSGTHYNTVVGNNCNGNDSGDTGTYDGIHIYGSDGNLILGNQCQNNDRWGIMVDIGSDYNKVSNNYTSGNTAGSIRVNHASCDNTQITWNTVEEGAPGDIGTATRSYGNYDPSANAFVGDVGAPPF